MKKIKFGLNDRCMSFEFIMKLSKLNSLTIICNSFDLQLVYLDIFNFNIKNEENLKKILNLSFENKIKKNSKKYCDVSMKTNIQNLDCILELLKDNGFDELNIWNDYIEFNKHVNPELLLDNIESTFYLNYNPYESSKVELICGLDCDKDTIYEKINEII